MAESSHDKTEALQHVADEVDQERQQKGHLPSDDAAAPGSDDGTTREDHESDASPLGNVNDSTRAGAIGAAGRIRGPGL